MLKVDVSSDQILYHKFNEFDSNTMSIILNLLEDGKQIMVAEDAFDLYYVYDKNMNGELDDLSCEDVGAHAMSVVGVTEDNRLIVSSWGNAYILDPEAIYGTCIIDYEGSSNNIQLIDS